MFNQISQKIRGFFSLDLDKQERAKIVWLSAAFFCVIGAYTVIKEMKDILFAQIVGGTSMYKVKLLSMFVLLPATLLYAKLVDKMDRFKLLCFYCIIYGVGGLIISYFLSDPVIGLANPIANDNRWFGWFVYLFYEGVVPFVVSVFWAFANSITKPDTAKKGYPIIIAGSKVGGMVTAGLAYVLFRNLYKLPIVISSIALHQLFLASSSILLGLSPIVIYMLTKRVGEKGMQGYQAVYEVEKEQELEGKSDTGMLSGLKMFYKYPYILGIFGMVFFYEMINVVLSIQRTVILQSLSKDAAEFTGSMFGQRFSMHFVGFLTTFFGTRVLMKWLGERICLLLMPIITGILLLYFMLVYNQQAIMFVFMALGMLNYALASPIREALYIPTVKDIRFKSKSWIESFGQRFSKGFASSVIGSIQSIAAVGTPLYVMLFSGFFATVIVLWTLVAWMLGKKYVSVVKNKEVIGAE